jgi:hypothetical protein
VYGKKNKLGLLPKFLEFYFAVALTDESISRIPREGKEFLFYHNEMDLSMSTFFEVCVAFDFSIVILLSVMQVRKAGLLILNEIWYVVYRELLDDSSFFWNA